MIEAKYLWLWGYGVVGPVIVRIQDWDCDFETTGLGNCKATGLGLWLWGHWTGTMLRGHGTETVIVRPRDWDCVGRPRDWDCDCGLWLRGPRDSGYDFEAMGQILWLGGHRSELWLCASWLGFMIVGPRDWDWLWGHGPVMWTSDVCRRRWGGTVTCTDGSLSLSASN